MAGGAPIGPGAFFGLASGISWGAGDFAGGLIGRYATALLAVLVSQTLGLVSALFFVALSTEAMPDQASLVWAAAAGASGVLGVGCFYYALSRGTMGIIAPLAALIGAGVPVLLDIYGGAELPAARLIGIAIALVAVLLISLPTGAQSVDERRRQRIDIAELPFVIGSGLGFAGFFVFIDMASAGGAVWWPLATVRVVGVVFVVIAVAGLMLRLRGTWTSRGAHVLGLQRARAHAPNAVVAIVVLATAGLGDLGGNVFFVLAVQSGEFAVSVILSSLYPVITTLMAAIFLRERLSPLQLLGVGLATFSVILLR